MNPMKRSLRVLAGAALLAFALGTQAALPASPGGAAAEAPALADLHKSHKLACKSCHGESKPQSLVPEEALARANASCVSCHGDMAKMAAVSKPKLANPHVNPHASHLVQIDCVTCHKGHEPEQSYCVQCHAFDMPMPTARKKK
jgi:fumarate reductase flavoprotein subunit